MSEIQQEEQGISIQIRRIKQVYFSIDEQAMRSSDPFQKLDIAYKLEYNLDKEYVSLMLKIGFIYPQSSNPHVQVEVQNIFEIKELKKFISPDEHLNLPNNLFVTLLSLSISHTRAIMAINIAGTVFNDSILPIIDPEEILTQFLGKTSN